uniref:Uncharacterized protein n=1 Tax=Romanomermis culicivorax TaxID=13658 RepID=A0A915KVF5_ROMCU
MLTKEKDRRKVPTLPQPLPCYRGMQGTLLLCMSPMATLPEGIMGKEA